MVETSKQCPGGARRAVIGKIRSFSPSSNDRHSCISETVCGIVRKQARATSCRSHLFCQVYLAARDCGDLNLVADYRL